jgi:spermidine/putrescine transport system substrate-binding protein
MRKLSPFLMALALVGIVGVTACAKRAEAPAPPAIAENAGPTEPTGPCAINLFIWSEYIDPEIVKSFEQKYTCKVTTEVYEDNESMIAKLQAGGTSQYDIVVPSGFVVPGMIHLGLLAELRHANIPNLANLDEKFANPAFDPGNKYTAAYQWGTVGIYLRKSQAKSYKPSWNLLFDPKQQPGPFLMMDSIREMLGSALKFQGKSVNTTNPTEIEAAGALLIEAKKRSQGFEGGVGGKNKVLGKEVTAAVVYNGDAARGMTDDKDTQFFVPDEGGVIWVDSMVIPAKAPHRDWAEKFIDYILDAKVGAQLSNFNQYATPNKAAKPLIKPEDLANPAIYPTPEMMAKLELVGDVGDASKLYDEIWTRVKSK